MRSRLICTILSLFILPAAMFGQMLPYSTEFACEERPYWLYLPDNSGPETPLVILLHGHGGKAEGYRPEMAGLAKKEGFALCLPQGLKDSKVDKSGWNVRYPVQEGLKRDDIAFVRYLRRHLSKKFGIAKKNVFLCGMSNGGEMCYIMAYRYPKEFKAIASVAGLTMQWLCEEYKPKGPVPFMEIHGTADRTSRWDGDPDNEGGWGKYIAVPAAVKAIADVSGCSYELTETIPSKRNPIILHRFLRSPADPEESPSIEVRLYEIQGGGHSWALKDMDTCQEIWNFFRNYLE